MEFDASTQGQEGLDLPNGKPRARDWLWRPWYARIWWLGSTIYWAGKLASHWSSALDDLYTSALAGYLNIAFFPITILMILGVSFVTAWMGYRGIVWGQPPRGQLFPPLSVGGLRDPNSDPLDPKSGMIHWRHFHPHD